MKRSPPRVRESAVGVPPLSQLHREGRILEVKEASLASKDTFNPYPKITPNKNSQSPLPQSSPSLIYDGEEASEIEILSNKKIVTQRGKGKKARQYKLKRAQNRETSIPKPKSSGVDSNVELLKLLSDIQQQMTIQSRENQELRLQLRQLQEGQLRSQIPQSPALNTNRSMSDGLDDRQPVFTVENESVINRQHPLPTFNNRNNRTEIPRDLRVQLDNGVSPTYDAWKHLMRANLKTFRHCFQDQLDVIDHIFAQTTGSAMAHLTQRMKPDHPQTFTHENEVFEWLEGFFKDPNERETARIEYNRCQMSINETFNQFYGRFSALASKARVEQPDQLRDMFRKLHPDLHQLAINYMATDPDYQSALKRFHFLDNELRINRDYRARRTKMSSIGPSAFTSSSPRTISGQTPIKQESPNSSRQVSSQPEKPHYLNRSVEGIIRKCYNCRKVGHMSRDCPEPQENRAQTGQVQQIQIGMDDMKIRELDDDIILEDSENERL